MQFAHASALLESRQTSRDSPPAQSWGDFRIPPLRSTKLPESPFCREAEILPGANSFVDDKSSPEAGFRRKVGADRYFVYPRDSLLLRAVATPPTLALSYGSLGV